VNPSELLAESNDLFRHSKALDGAPAYRNINRRIAEAAFDDLLDPQDSHTDSSATRLALRQANRVRANVSPFAALDPAGHYYFAIQSVFQRAAFYPTRYSDGSYPVWYGCLDPLTTIHETAYHMVREAIDLRDHPRPIVRQRLIYQVACTAILIDVSRSSRYHSRLADPGSYTFTQRVGKRVRTENHPGLLVPSARRQTGINLVIFTPAVLSNPELRQRLTYRLEPASLELCVYDQEAQEAAVRIDGRKWA
jgi:hypothetical protein